MTYVDQLSQVKTPIKLFAIGALALSIPLLLFGASMVAPKGDGGAYRAERQAEQDKRERKAMLAITNERLAAW